MKVRRESKRNEFSGQLWRRIIENSTYRGVAQLVERVVWDHQVARSSRVTPTKIWPGGQMVKSPLNDGGGV